MSSFDVVDPMKLAGQLIDGTLEESSTGMQLASASLSAPFSSWLPGVAFGAGAGAAVSMFAYGSGSVDPEGVVGRPPGKAGALDQLVLPPPLAPEKRVYLSYRLDVNASASAGGGLGFLGAAGQVERRVRLSDYRAHPPTQLVRDAVLADLFQLRSILKTDEVKAILPGDALALSTTGRIAATLQLSWSDLLPGVIGRLAALLPGAEHLLAVETSLGASLHADASLQDDLVLVISRPEAGRLRVSVLRAETCAAGAGGALSASVSFDASSPVEAVLGALCGRPLAWIDETVARVVQGVPLDDYTRGALKFVLDRIGLEGGEADPAGLLERWGTIKEMLRDQLRELVTVRIGAGLTYDFQRTEQKQALFQAIYPDAEALAQHGALLGGDLGSLLRALSAAGRAPEIYLRQQSIERRHAWGFSLGLLVTSASSTDEDRLRFVTTTREDGQKRLAALGARSYRGDLLGATAEWNAELRAEMPGFSAAPKAGDFQYGLHLLIRRQDGGPGAGALAQLVDDAVVWGAVSENDRTSVLEQVTAKARAGGEVDARVELTLSDQALRAVLPAAIAAAADRPLLARALARAMPWYGWRVRQNADVRAAAYAPLWEGVLRDGRWAPKAAAIAAQGALARHPLASDIAASEGQWPTPGLLTFASLVNAYPTAAATSLQMVEGLAALARTIDSVMPADAIDAAFQKLKGGWGQSFLLKAFGALVVALAAQRGATKLVDRTFTVSFPDADAMLAFTTSSK